MPKLVRVPRYWFGLIALTVALLGIFSPVLAHADEPTPDTTGAFQTTPTGASIPNYTKPDPEKATTKELAAAIDAVAQSSSRSYFSINFVWVLIAGFLVIFMQAGFALVETGLIRAKNVAHTMSMNFAVYALGMFGFFVSGFALMCVGMNGTNIGGPAMLCRLPTLNHQITSDSAVARKHCLCNLGTY